MEAPPSRYRVIEKDGRLVVVDTVTGAATGGEAPVPGHPAGAPVSAGKGLMATLADLAAEFTSRGRDSGGRLVIAWEWTRNGRKQRWDAALDARQQRRLGRALLLIAAPIPLVVLMFLVGQPFFGMIWGVPLILAGAFGLNRLQSETERTAQANPLRKPGRRP